MHARVFVFATLVLALSACTSNSAGTPGQLDPQPADPATIDACVSLAQHFRDACATANGPTDDRVRLWNGYAALCHTGDTELLLSAMRCLDATQCRTFSDANDGNECLDGLAASMQPMPIHDVIANLCDRCGAPGCPTGRAEIFPYLPPSEADVLARCAATAACSVDGVVTACEGDITQLAPFAAH